MTDRLLEQRAMQVRLQGAIALRRKGELSPEDALGLVVAPPDELREKSLDEARNPNALRWRSRSGVADLLYRFVSTRSGSHVAVARLAELEPEARTDEFGLAA